MDTAIIAVSITAAASLAASIFSLVTARQARAAGEKLKIIEANLADQKEAHTRLRVFLRACEELRITCRHMIDRIENVQTFAKRYAERTEAFDSAWSDLKADIPDDYLEFVRSLRHEALTPLRAISGYIGILTNEQPAPETKAEYIETVRRNLARSLDDLILVSSTVQSLKNEIYLNALSDKRVLKALD